MSLTTFDSAFVGREKELATLLQAVLDGPELITIEGEAGIGKTRLVKELLARSELRSHQRLTGHCFPLREPFPMGPVLQGLRSATLPRIGFNRIVGVLQPLLPELTESLPSPPSDSLDPRAALHRQFRALSELFRALGPTVFVLEDAHWADEVTEDFLTFLLTDMPAQLSIVLTFREQDLSASSRMPGIRSPVPTARSFLELTLAPLDLSDVTKLVASTVGEDVASSLGRLIHARTGGIPFAVEELVRLWTERREVLADLEDVKAWPDDLAVPPAIRAAIVDRLMRLVSDARLMIQAAATIGIPASEELIGQVSGIPPARWVSALEESLRSGLLHESSEGQYFFRHLLARDAVYDEIRTPSRRALHRRALRALEPLRPQPLSQMALHSKEAGAKDWMRYAEAAADRAISVGEYATVAKLLRDALRLSEPGSARRRRILLKIGQAHIRGLAYAEGIGVVREVLREEPLEPIDRVRLRMTLAWLLIHAGQGRKAVNELRRSLDESKEEPLQHARVAATLALTLVGFTDEDPVPFLSTLDEAIAAVVEWEDEASRLAILADRAVVNLVCGRPEHREVLDALPGKSDDPETQMHTGRALGNMADALRLLGPYTESESYLSKELTLRQSLGDSGSWLWASQQTTRALLDHEMGNWDGLERRFQSVARGATDMDSQEVQLALLSLRLAKKGPRGGLQRALEELLERATRTDCTQLIPPTTAQLARLLLLSGRPRAAVEWVERALALIRRKGMWVWGCDLLPISAQCFMAVGAGAKADGLVRDFRKGLRGADAPAALAGLQHSEAIVARGGASAVHRRFMGAVAAWEDLPRPYYTAICLEHGGEALIELDPRTGEEMLRTSVGGFERLGAGWDAARVTRTLRQRGVTLFQRRGRRGYGEELSPREREVARLVKLSWTNREIAEALFLSAKTVENHVASARRKLGISSRKDFANVDVG